MTLHLAMAKRAYQEGDRWTCGDCGGRCMTYPDPVPGEKVTFVICQDCERGDVIDEPRREVAA